MHEETRRRLLRILASIAAVIAVTIGLVEAIDPADQPDKPATVTTKVDGADKDRARDDKVVAPESAVREAKRVVEDKLRTPPAATPPEQLAEAKAKADEIRQTQKSLPTAGASQGFPGCKTRFVRNQGSRGAVRPQVQVAHYAVIRNRPGRSDVDGLTIAFDRYATKASSNFIIDAEGHCNYIVPIERSAWTQAALNPFSVSYEFIAYGDEKDLTGPAGYAKWRLVAREVARRTGIPIRRGRVNNCTPTVRGIVQHADGGICAGGHTDIGPFSLDKLIKIAAGETATSTSKSTKAERLIVSRRFYHWSKYHQAKGTAARRVQLRYSRLWSDRAGAKKGRFDVAHSKGQPWTQDAIGPRRLVMARTERFSRSDRAYLRR